MKSSLSNTNYLYFEMGMWTQKCFNTSNAYATNICIKIFSVGYFFKGTHFLKHVFLISVNERLHLRQFKVQFPYCISQNGVTNLFNFISFLHSYLNFSIICINYYARATMNINFKSKVKKSTSTVKAHQHPRSTSTVTTFYILYFHF